MYLHDSIRDVMYVICNGVYITLYTYMYIVCKKSIDNEADINIKWGFVARYLIALHDCLISDVRLRSKSSSAKWRKVLEV